MSDKFKITNEQIEILDNMCFGANEVQLGTLLYNTKDEIDEINITLEQKVDKASINVTLERIKYYGSADIVPSDESYFTVNETGETITGLTDTGKTQTELVIPYKINGVEITSIGEYAFQGCTALTSINIPNSVTSIGNGAFYNCSSLKSVNISNSVTSIENGTFCNCSSLTSIDIPNSVTSIGNSAFQGCTALTSINIPNSVTSIGSCAFQGCTNLKIYCEQGSYADLDAKHNGIPVVYTDVKDIATETEIERLKYYGDKDIIPSDESYFTVNSTGETITGLTDTGKTQTELVIPYEINGVEITTLGGEAFNSCTSLTSINIPNSVTSIGSAAFYSCTSLTKIDIPNSVTSIGDGAFGSCTSLTSINIPNSVTSIGDGAFGGCTSLTSINIPNSVIGIGIGTFSGCSSLKSINIPNSETSISPYAFNNCSSLTSINIPNSVTSISESAFNNCSSLTSINIPNSVTSILESAFYGTNLKIYCEQGSYAETYAKSSNIPIVYTEVKAEVIDNKADKSTTLAGYGITDAYTKGEIDSKISNVYEIKGSSTIANLPTNPEVGDVYNITDSGTITGTEIVVSVGDNIVYTSEGWDKLAATVDLSSYATETELERLKYYGDKDIVPSPENYFTVNSTGETITGLTDAGKTQTELVIPYEINGVKITTLYSGSDGISGRPVSILDGNNTITKVVIPKSVTTLGGAAFYGCSSLTSVNIPNSVTSIGNHVFCNCSSLTSIDIPNSVTSIGRVAFCNCSSLTSINIPNRVTSIGYAAFEDCISLISINIPNSVTSIGDYAFSGCPNLKIYCEQGSYAETYANENGFNIVYTDVSDIATETELERLKYYGDKDIIPSDESYFTVNSTGETITGLTDAGKTQTELVIPYEINGVKITTLHSGSDGISGPPVSILDGNSTITKVVVPNSVTTFGIGAFFDCSSLTSINIPNRVTSIGYAAFARCSGLTSVNIPNSVTSIGNSAFGSCTSLTSIDIPNSVTSIAEYAFSGCTSLKSINIPNSVTSIGEYAFENCSSLTSINIPNSVTSIENGTFMGCTSLTSINIPNSVTSIGRIAFLGCTSLTSINIPNSVTSIGERAFSDCTSLTSINISNSVTSIENGTFSDCTSLTLINIPNSVTSIEYGAFSDCPNLKIYCEQGSYADTYAKSKNIPVVYTAVKDIGSNVEIVDNLTTSDGTKALSALQGKILNDKIKNLNIEASEIILCSSTEGSAKKFRLTIDDNGTLSSVEI